MIHSMTGYAAASVESPRGALAIELRSVNARFLDVQMRVAEELRALEPMRRRLEEVAPLVPQSLAAYQAKLAERLREAIGSALGSADDDRVRAELAVFAAKVDVDEELERL